MGKPDVVIGLVLCSLGVTWLAAASPAAREAAGQTSAASGQPQPAAQEARSARVDLVKRLAGVWKAPEYKIERTSALDVQVFGAHASDIRNVDLTLQPSGEGVLKIHKSVVGQKGKVYAPSIIEAKLMVGPAEPTITGRLQPAVTVTAAEERYLDGSGDKWSRNGARVTITTDQEGSELDVRYEGPNGQESFVTDMTRRAKR